MARAPQPGSTAPAGPSSANEGGFKITVNGEVAIVRPGDFGPRDDALVRRETKAAYGEKQSLMAALMALGQGEIGLDSICLLWWLGRRKAGETTESLSDALDRFPSYAEADSAIDLAELLPDDDTDDDGSGND
jgi:hypothetical protein